MERYAKEIHKPVRRHFPRQSVVANEPNELWGADLVQMPERLNDNGNRFILTIVDIYSRYAWAIPLKDKSGQAVLNAFKKVKKAPELLWVDEGKEFFNEEVKNYFKRRGTHMYHTYSGMKSVYAERFNRTLKEKMWERMDAEHTDKWVHMVNDLVKEYNDTEHSSIKNTPAEVYLKDGVVSFQGRRIPPKTKPKFKVGDFVRISLVKGVFDKGYEQNWSDEVYVVASINETNPTTFDIKDQKGEAVKGKFYQQELMGTTLKDHSVIEKVLEVKGKKALVRYKGWDKKWDDWVPLSRVKGLI